VVLCLSVAACVTRNEGACMSDEACETDEVCYFESPEDTLGECVPAGDADGQDGTEYPDGDGPDGEDGDGDDDGQAALTVNRDVDVLFVIDNSGSMGEEQELLATSFSSFIAVLEREDVQANYRIGITTTDNGNPWCSGTTPEGGALRFSSCLGRLSEFVFPGFDPPADERSACTNVCPEEWASIDTTPTTTEYENDPWPRPWIESIEGGTNLPAGLTVVQALQCISPQGINGCGFESHLESMYKALKRAMDADEASYGFLRQNAILAVIVLTDEVDCSHRNEHQIIFMPDGNRVFWSDPDAAYPTSAVCWNAGVSCMGGPGTYDDCYFQDKDEDGNSTSEANAVLHPISRYVGLLQDFENQKKMRNPGQEVLVSIIGGVPEGYVDGQDLVYQDSTDPAFQDDYGIGPGCQSSKTMAVPPVRIREFAEQFMVGGERNLLSVCASDYSTALRTIAERIADQIRPACMPVCVADADNDPSNGLTPSCTLVQETPGGGVPVETTVRPCSVDLNAGTWDFPSGSDDVCYRMLTSNATPTTMDDIYAECFDEGWNLEFMIERRPGTPAPVASIIRATCEPSGNVPVDCPGL